MVLQEAEAIKYLGRLSSSLDDHFLAQESRETRTNFILQSVFKVEKAYLSQLLAKEESRELAVLTIGPSGFPEISSLLVDLKKAYQILDSAQARVGNSVMPLFDRIQTAEDLDRLDRNVETIISNYESEQRYIELIKDLKGSVDQFSSTDQSENRVRFFIDPNEPSSLRYFYIFEDKSKPDLFSTSHKQQTYLYQVSGSYKYIDSRISRSILIKRNGIKTLKPKESGEPTSLTVFGNEKVRTFLRTLSPRIRDKILAIDFTELPDGSFDRIIDSSNRLGSLLQVAGQQSEVVRDTSKSERVKQPGLIRRVLKAI